MLATASPNRATCASADNPTLPSIVEGGITAPRLGTLAASGDHARGSSNVAAPAVRAG